MNKAETAISSTDQSGSSVKEIQSILYLLQESIERLKNEADRSYALFEVGTKTPLTKKIEDFVKNPLKGIIESSSTIDIQVKSLISRLVEQFFISKNDILRNVFLTKNPTNDLHYSIVLKNDTIENRASIFLFFELYNQLDMYYRYPIFFQFVPEGLLDKINITSEINLQKKSEKQLHSTGQA
jgi:hypothetical protein